MAARCRAGWLSAQIGGYGHPWQRLTTPDTARRVGAMLGPAVFKIVR